jgi:penicillin-binding protein-related factor A (putative recombinase)
MPKTIKKYRQKQLKESEITRQIKDVLDICKIFYFKHWSGPFTSKKGIADIIGIYKGRFLAIEVKSSRGKVSPEQKKFIDDVNREGGVGLIVYDVDRVINALNLPVRL